MRYRTTKLLKKDQDLLKMPPHMMVIEF